MFNQVTIIGLGLIGGSLGLAIRRKRLARRVIGVSRKPSTLRRAMRIGAIDEGSTDLRRAVSGAELVILATPVDLIVSYAKRIAPWLQPGSLISDVGSTKATIVQALEHRLPRPVAFVGTHPLAGSERRGIDAASATLFDGSLCVVTKAAATNPQALARVRRLWSRIAGRAVVMSPREHDQALAAVSHLPHLVAFCLMGATNHGALMLAPRSFLDATRVAKSDPDLWDDIFLTNRIALARALRQFQRQLDRTKTLLSRADRAGLRRFLKHTHALRLTL